MGKLQIYEAILHTGGKTKKDILDQDKKANKDSDNILQIDINSTMTNAEIDNTITYYNMLDGLRAFVMPGIGGKGYMLVGAAAEEYKNRYKEAMYLMEQDAYFGAYIGMRDEFNQDWDSGNYCPEGIVGLDEDEVEILGEVH